MYACIYRVYVCMRAWVCACMCLCACTLMCSHMCVRVCVYVYMCVLASFVGRKTLQHSRQDELRSNETEFEQQLAVLNDSHQTKLEQVMFCVWCSYVWGNCSKKMAGCAQLGENSAVVALFWCETNVTIILESVNLVWAVFSWVPWEFNVLHCFGHHTDHSCWH